MGFGANDVSAEFDRQGHVDLFQSATPQHDLRAIVIMTQYFQNFHPVAARHFEIQQNQIGRETLRPIPERIRPVYVSDGLQAVVDTIEHPDPGELA
jgi:hypothetical protein